MITWRWLVWAGMSVSLAQAAAGTLEREAEDWLRGQFESISCDGGHYIYGVAYIDGSYMERIFYVDDSGNQPRLEVRFRDQTLQEANAREDVRNAPFLVEVTFERALHGVIRGDSWQNEGGWETALRFKYTSWFGDLSWSQGRWQAQWQGYRRPMLPEALSGDPEAACRLFEDGG